MFDPGGQGASGRPPPALRPVAALFVPAPPVRHQPLLLEGRIGEPDLQALHGRHSRHLVPEVVGAVDHKRAVAEAIDGEAELLRRKAVRMMGFAGFVTTIALVAQVVVALWVTIEAHQSGDFHLLKRARFAVLERWRSPTPSSGSSPRRR